MLTFMLACVNCTSHVTSLGWGGGDVSVHVNLRLSKSAIPCSPPTRSNGHVNPKLMRSIRVWQWRWVNSTTKGLMEVTGQALKNRMAMWVGKKFARVFRHKFPVNYRSSLKNHFKIPGIFKTIFRYGENDIFFKTLKTLARFSPRREVCDMLWEPTASLFQGKKRLAGYNSKGEKQPTWRDVWVVSIYNQTRETWSHSVFSLFHDESFHQKYPRSHSGLG